MLNLKLGIIYRDGKIINHRSFLKVIFNPVLRYFGYQIATQYCDKTDTLGGVLINKCEKVKNIRWEKYDDKYVSIVKKRTLI